MQTEYNDKEKIQIVKTDEGSLNGQNKCPKCGATEISLNTQNGKLRCCFCRHEFEPLKVASLQSDISNLEGQVIGSGAQDIVQEIETIETFKCTSCGAEVVIDTSTTMQARCHWCRNILSMNEQIPNGSIPDIVLPFGIPKEEARKQIDYFVNKRKSFAHPKFKSEFQLDNIMGVYFPYMVVDMRTHAVFTGQGEHLLRTYSSNNQTYYDAEVYDIVREFDLDILGLTVESNKERLEHLGSDKTNNVINAIMPFDIENGVHFDANYLKGYTSERRNTNIDDLKNMVHVQAKDIARFATNDTLKNYDRGVAFKQEQVDILGERWITAYLPVWLYSYQQVNGEKKILHYVAVNGRTKETMGSVPIHYPKLLGVSASIEILGIILFWTLDFNYNYLFLFAGFIYFFLIFFKYRNINARHTYEIDTKRKLSNVKEQDRFVGRRNKLSYRTMNGANNKRVSGAESSAVFNSVENLLKENSIYKIVKENIKNESEK